MTDGSSILLTEEAPLPQALFWGHNETNDFEIER